MTNCKRHAIVELDILSSINTDKDNIPIVEPFKDEIIALCEKFGLIGQSGGSAPITASCIIQTIEKLLSFNPICEITGNDDEFIEVAEGIFQNKRCSAIFKENGRYNYVDAIVKVTENNIGYSGSFWITKEDFEKGDKSLKISTNLFIKSFPFTPKTFYIDVIEIEVAKDDWEMIAKDINQVNEALEYYDRF